jgi:hypothetical protein
MSDTHNLIEKLSQVDLEIVTKPKKGAISEAIESVIGPSRHTKKLEKKRTKILQNKKVMLINSHPVPNSGKELIALGNLALSSYKTTDVKNEKEAWKNKMILILNKLQNIVISNQGEEIADDYLFLSDEIEQIIEKDKKRKGLFRK